MTTNHTETVTSMISYIHTNSSSLSSSPSMSATPSQTPSPVYVPLLNPCPSLAPENPNIILIQRDYLYGSGMVILLIFFMNICYTNWLYGKYSALKKRPIVVNNSLV
jgi:hypothetical protein